MNKVIDITTTGVSIHPYYKRKNVYFENLTSSVTKLGKRLLRNPETGFYIESDNTGYFVSHLHSDDFLKAQFPGYAIIHKEPTKARQLGYELALNPDITPREVQYEIIQGIINQKHRHQWFVYLSQGLGKTLLSVYMITYFNVKTLIMCYNKDILSQWHKTILDHTNIDKNRILMIQDSKLLWKIICDDFPSYEYDIFMCTPKLLTSFANKKGYHYLDVLMEKLGIGLKIYDEAHRNIANIIKINAFTSIDKTLYLSGDFGQSSKTKEALYYKIFHGVPILKPSTELMNTLKFTQAIVMKYNSNPSELDKASIYTRRGISYYEYMKYQINTEIFFDVLSYTVDMIHKANQGKYKILILVNMIDHVDILCKFMRERYGLLYNVCPYHSKIEDEEKEYCKEHANMIISTYQSFSTGLDVSLIKYIISCSICTKIDDNQSSGRARPLPDGSDAYYFMFADDGFEYTGKKLKQRVEYLKETKIKAVTEVTYV